MGKESADEIAQREKISRRELGYWFKPFRQQNFTCESLNCEGEYLTIDGLEHNGEITLVAAVSPDKVVAWKFVERENFQTWREFLSSIPGKPKAIVGDGQKGMAKALRELYPDVPFQRCRFHVYNYVKKRLKSHPRSIPAKSLKALSILATKVNSFSDLKVWLILWDLWNRECGGYLQEKSCYINERGRKCWYYMHKDLHAAYSHLRNAIPFMFNFIWFPGLPATSNILEGGINSPIRNQLHFHRGATLQTQRQIISLFLRSRRR